MDAYGDHALVCSCNGERTLRHNALRNQVCDEAAQGGLRPEKEKPGLLPQRPESDGLHTSVDARRRRPADIWLPSGQAGTPEALDFACTSGLRADLLSRSVVQAPAVFAEYEHAKRSFKDTDQSCETQGFRFVPMIAEAHSGAWSPLARKVLDGISQKAATAASTFVTPEFASLRFAQRLSITLHREHARAIARRMSVPGTSVHDSAWDSFVD